MGNIFKLAFTPTAFGAAKDLLTPKVPGQATVPAPVDINVEDKINGTKSTIVTNPDGTKTQVIEQNLTPEQKAVADNLKQLSDASLAKYEALLNDPFLDTMPEYKAQVESIYNTQVKSLNDAYRGASKATELTANRYGVDDSTAATQLRSANTQNLAGASQQLSNDKIGLTNSIRNQEMSNQLQAYGLASGRQDTLLANSLQTLGLGNQIAMQNAARNDNYANNLYNAQQNYNNAVTGASNQGRAAVGQLVGTGLGYAVGGPFGASIGGNMGFGATGTKTRGF